MSHKSAQIAQLIRGCQGKGRDAHYLGYFECFNQGLFYEAHDVLEELWLECRKEPAGNFYKALIQFTGAFVHLQKDRLRPAGSLFRLASGYLHPFVPHREGLDVTKVLALIEEWLGYLESGEFKINPLRHHPAPRLIPDAAGCDPTAS